MLHKGDLLFYKKQGFAEAIKAEEFSLYCQSILQKIAKWPSLIVGPADKK